MNFLKAFGAAALKILELVSGFAPFVQGGASSATQLVISELAKIMKVVMDVEAFGQALNLTGDDMLKAEIPAVSQIILDSLSVINPKFEIKDPARYQMGVAQVTNGVVDILKSLNADAVTTTKLGA